jgi:hypothetical protein
MRSVTSFNNGWLFAGREAVSIGKLKIETPDLHAAREN